MLRIPRVQVLGAVAAIGLASLPAAQDCPNLPGVELLRGGTNQGLGRATLAAETLPEIGLPFQLRVSGGVPGSHGCLIFGRNETAQLVAELGGQWFVDGPFGTQAFTVDAQGQSPPLVDLPVAFAELCGLTYVAQALVDDPSTPFGVGLSNGLRVKFGNLAQALPVLDALDSPTAAADALVSGGGVTPGAEVLVEGGAAPVLGVAAGDGNFAVTVPLTPNQAQTLFARESLTGGGYGSPAVAVVVQDGAAPELEIDWPLAGSTLNTTTTHVVGRVGDSLSGFLGLEVEVNGVPAVVDSGIGTNGTFDIADVALNLDGPTQIVAVARDVLGNEVTWEVEVLYRAPEGFALAPLDGDGQSGPAGSELPQPVRVALTKPDGSPLVGKLVRFEVTRSDGELALAPGAEGQRVRSAMTDGSGVAEVYWRLGSDAGCGNQRLAVTSEGCDGTAYFCASAQAGPATQINVGNGAMQSGGASAQLGEALSVWVSDGLNPAAGAAVTFAVVQGSGTLREGSGPAGLVIETTTDATGHAAVDWTLGPLPGNNRVEARLAGSGAAPATFTARALPLAPAGTGFRGLVLDNSGQPIASALCELELAGGATLATSTDLDGRFEFTALATAGPGDLHVDGALATHAGGRPIDFATTRFPALHFMPFMHAGLANELPQPIYLPRLLSVNDRSYDGTEEVVLTAAGIEGFEMRVAAGTQVVLPDGSVASPSSPVTLSLNPVHRDEIPMPLPDGAAPPFAWTLQPGGTHFDPPVEVRYPNSAGLAPGSIGYLLSFDHDTNRFEIVATGAVSADGAQLVSDPGGGISISGWGGLCPPYLPNGGVEDCGEGECTDNGELLPAMIQVNSKAVKRGGSACFSVAHIADTGGEQAFYCLDGPMFEAIEPPPELQYQGTLTEPDGTELTVSVPQVIANSDQTGEFKCVYGVSAIRECQPSTLIMEERVYVIDGDIEEPSTPGFGYDDVTDPDKPWLSLSAGGDAATLDAFFAPEDAFEFTELTASNINIADGDFRETAGFVEAFEVTPALVGEAEFTWDISEVSGDDLGCPVDTAIDALSVAVYEPQVVKVAVQLVHELQDDVAVIDPGRGEPGTICISSVLPLVASTPGGDDQAVGSFVHTGENGVCETEAVFPDIQVIDFGNGKPNTICIGPGENGIGDTGPLGDDQASGLDGALRTGPNGLCDTLPENEVLFAPAPPSLGDLAAELEEVFLHQARVEIQLTELDPLFAGYDVDWDDTLNNDDIEPGHLIEAANVANDLSGFDKVLFYVTDTTSTSGCPLGFAYVNGKYGFVESGNTQLVLEVFAHELGHNLGLLHEEDDPDNLMFPTAVLGSTALRKHQWDLLNPGS